MTSNQSCGSEFNDFLDPLPDLESGSRLQIQGQEREEIEEKICGTFSNFLVFINER
jgi:hypothetical protein